MPQKVELRDFPEKLAAAPAPRPHLTAQHSNSLPSSPYQNPRQLSFGGRSPSPEKLTKDASPKSNDSEPEKRPRSGSKAPSLAGCRHETGMAFSRRRIPYSIGGDQLDRAKAPPKKYMNPSEESKLSGDMRELYDRILPSAESERSRTDFIQKLEQILNQQWPGNDIKVHVFGSSGNMLCTSDSDVDICITTPMKALERVCLLANALAEHGMERVVCVPHAKVPIVKFWDPELKLACDMNVNNTLALENTRMIKTYVEIDERVRPLAMIIKQWTKRRVLNDAALGGTLSSYTWICLILSFLQTRNPPILPSLHKKPHLRKPGADGQIAAFDDDIEKLRGFGYHNTETLGELLFQFFRRYGYDFDYEKNVISVRDGRLLSKEAKKWNFMQNNRLCVEEPFNTERNLGNTADDTSFRGIHTELRRAFDMVKDAKLDECLEEYAFPATEEKIWEKPAARPPPVLTRSRSQSGSTQAKRGGQSNRGGGRHNQYGQRGHTQHQPRRASSAAAQNKFSSTQPGLHSSGGRDYLPRENALQASLDQIQLHNELFARYQILQAQEEELRRIQTASQIQARVQAHRSYDDASMPPQPRDQSHRIHSNNSYIPLTAPSRNAQYFHPFAYPQVPGTPQQNVHTQPSSPSLKHAQPDLRRGVHRSFVADGTSNNRSHSQPARPVPLGLAVQNAPPLPLNSQAWLQYQQQLRQQQIHDALEMHQPPFRLEDVQMYQDPRLQPMGHHFEESVPKEYIGYWVNDSPPPRHYREDPTIQRVPAYNELHPRIRGVPQSFSRLRNGSRSPSPSPAVPFRDRSFSIRSASSAPPQPAQTRLERVQTNSQAPRTSGPIIANGNDGWNMPDYSSMVPDGSSHTTTMSEATSGSEDRLYDTPASADAEICGGQGFGDGFTVDEPQQYFQPNPAAEGMRIPLSNRNGACDSNIRRTSHQIEEAIGPSSNTQRSEKGVRPAGGLGIQFGEHQFQRAPAKQEPAVLVEKTLPAVQTSPPKPIPEQAITRADNVLMPVPLLSPVREVATPSPTAKRKQDANLQVQSSPKPPAGKLDLYIPSFAEITRRKQGQTNGVLDVKPNGVHPSQFAPSAKAAEPPRGRHLPSESPKSPKSHVQQPQANGWQTQSGKKGKKTKSRPGSGQLLPVEALPFSDYERKGG